MVFDCRPILFQRMRKLFFILCIILQQLSWEIRTPYINSRFIYFTDFLKSDVVTFQYV